MCISPITRRITSIGQVAPAMIPVRRVDRSMSGRCGWSSMAMNMVGTPYSAVAFSSATQLKVKSGSKASLG
ncbi:hypothetical protein D3C81_1396680 [compost metagenome]